MTHAIEQLLEKETKRVEKEFCVKVAGKMLKRGYPVEEIMYYTDLTHEEVEKLKL
jgi:SOS response regulatory protein OraA/RecX